MQKTKALTRYFRITRLLLHTLLGLAISTLIWPIISKQNKNSMTTWWCKGLLRCFNIAVVTHGKLPDSNTRNAMFIANHIGWADIHALNSVIPLRFIAKLEIKNWPVFGYLVKKSNTLFIDRSSRKDAVRIVHMAAQSLRSGDNIGFFPEGTTTEGTTLLPFKSSIIEAAISADATLCPVAIRYPKPDGSANILMAYAGETTLIESMKNVLNQKSPVVELHFLAPIAARDYNRQALTQAVFAAIAAQLKL